MPVGVSEVDFGTGGSWEASVVVTGRADVSGSSKVEPFFMATASPDHSADEHRVERIAAIAGEVVIGVGFTIWAKSTGNAPLYGRWSVHWVYNV
jgi:hypothetical protein